MHYNSTPLAGAGSPPPPNTNSNKPYPLPRTDATIISSHDPSSKTINVRWVSPDPDLTALITAAGEEHNLGRRSNACAEGGDGDGFDSGVLGVLCAVKSR